MQDPQKPSAESAGNDDSSAGNLEMEYYDAKFFGIKAERKKAEQGELTAQYFLGVYYDEGLGVPEDRMTAYAWLNIAAANGDTRAKSHKTKLAKKMSRKQIDKAQALSREMLKKNPKLCE